MRYLLDVVTSAQGVEHHVALPQHHGVAGRSGAVADESAARLLGAGGATLHVVDMRRNPLHLANATAVATLRRLISEVRPDVVHGHSSVGGAAARLAAWGQPAPCIYTPNGLMTSRPAVAIERVLGRGTDRFIAVSASEGERVVALRLVPASRVSVIPNGIDLDTGAPAAVGASGASGATGAAPVLRAQLGLAPGTPLVATVARVAAQKAPEQFVRACAAVARRRPDVHFLLVGLGPQQSRVDREVAAGRLTGRFHQIPHLEQAAAVMEQLDVFALLSRFEGGPYAPLEAMRAEVPVVLSDVVGNRDTVVHGSSGFLVPFGDSEAAADAIVNLLDDLALRAAVIRAATDQLRANFDVALMGQRLTGLYEELAGSRRSTRRLPHPRSGNSSKRPDPSASQ